RVAFEVAAWRGRERLVERGDERARALVPSLHSRFFHRRACREQAKGVKEARVTPPLAERHARLGEEPSLERARAEAEAPGDLRGPGVIAGGVATVIGHAREVLARRHRKAERGDRLRTETIDDEHGDRVLYGVAPVEHPSVARAKDQLA